MLTVLKQMFGYMRPYKLLACLFFFTLLLDLLFVSLAPLSFQFLIDHAIEPKDFDAFFLIITVLVVFGVIGLVAGIISDYVLSRLNARIQTDLQKKLFVHMQRLHIGFFQKTNPSDLVAYFSLDLPTIERAMTVILTTGIQSLVVVTITASVLFYLQWSMALLILVGAAVIFIGPYLLRKRAQNVAADYKEKLTEMTGDVLEAAKAQNVIKGFHLQQAIIHKFQERLNILFVSSYKRNVMGAQLERIPMISLLAINFTIIGFGSYLAMQGHITLGTLVAFFTMYTSMGNSVFNLTFALPALTEALVSMERINRLYREPEEAAGGTDSAGLESRRPNIAAKQVTFGYHPDRPVLRQVSLSIPAGSSVAFVGASGSGKSTMVQLLLGLYEPEDGEIRINGVPLQAVNRSLYRKQIGVVFQHNFLFRGTLLDNIRVSKPDATLEEVVDAAKQAEIHDFVSSLPDGYHTQVLDEGTNFSGGQRQRIAIARAILRDPAILLLDEATSALDPLAEDAIIRTFAKLSRDRTVLSVTHRLASITDADCIFVFDQGQVVESGTHAQLLQKDGFYKKLWDKQSGFTFKESGKEVEIDHERLSRLPFFHGIEPAVLQEIAGLFHTKTCAAGTPVIREGEAGDTFYVIARGRVEVTKTVPDSDAGHVRLAVLEDGDHFGEIALLEQIPRTATVSAMTPCVFLTLQRESLDYILSRYPEIDAHVRRTLQARKQ